MSPRYLDIADFMVACERLTGEDAASLRHRFPAHSVEAALLAPSAELDGELRHPHLAEQAAVLMAAILRLGGSSNETRLLAWVLMRDFLGRNGVPWEPAEADSEAARFALEGLVSGELSTAQVSAWIADHIPAAERLAA